MDLSVIMEAVNPFVFLGCLMVGFLIKLWVPLEWVNNKLIPTLLAVIGAVSYYFINGNSLEQAVIGAFVGISATGGYELVTNLISLIKEKTAQNGN